MMIANLGPADYNVDESLSTLRYASRAKHIQNKPRINEDPKDAMIREFHDEITRLREQLAALSGGKINMQGSGPGGQDMAAMAGAPNVVVAMDEEKMAEMQSALEKDKKAIRKQFEKERAKLEAQTAITEEEREKLLANLEVEQKAQ